ncbi:MAG: ArsR family transcriptional regulator [bacterium]|nr:ArsR family transcriptional regulator [bacterium]
MLSDVQQKFVLHWGEMGHRWGINRSMAQIHALLYLSPDGLHAEAIAEALSVARSNVSTSLRELQAWGVVKVVHVFGDRRDHFEAEKDVWALFRIILDERKRREIDPTIAALRECVADAGAEDDGYAQERIAEMLDFFEQTSGWYRAVGGLPSGALKRFVQMGDKVPRALGLDS